MYFKVFYTKDIRKKRKVYSEGVICCEDKRTKLFNQDGQCVFTSSQTWALEVGQDFILNYTYYITVQQQVTKEKFTSGKAFMCETVPSFFPKKKQTGAKRQNLSKNLFKRKVVELQSGLQIQEQLLDQLRPHQIEGVNFMYECLSGAKGNNVTGCILADFMGLGKTLQTLALIYSMLKMHSVAKSIVVCPLTLVSVWKKECEKWLENRLTPLICLGEKDQVSKVVRNFTKHAYTMLVISYQCFYKNLSALNGHCDLLIFDEGHRLKNRKSKFFIRLKLFSCKRRILLTGTPLQNNLEQLYSCISLVNPLMFDNDSLFRNVFQKPIMAGMTKSASIEERHLAQARTKELAMKIKEFSLRRKADILERYLPERSQYLVFLKLTPLQKLWYDRAILQKEKEDPADVMRILNLLRKLFIHPSIFKKDCIDKGQWKDYPEDCFRESSYKITFTLSIIKDCLKNKQKLIIVSYYTQNLDYFENILKELDVKMARLDGSIDGKKRQAIVKAFNNDKEVLLLSAKAGGTGLTLTCAHKMVMLEPDWNPSNDVQVMGRVWRQGQQDPVKIYRLIIVSSFQQKMLQRQHLKQTLSENLIDEKGSKNTAFDLLNLKKLFIKNFDTCLTFPKEENSLQATKESDSYFPTEGIVHLQLVRSHNKENEQVSRYNQFENAQFLLKNQSQEEEIQDESEDIDEDEKRLFSKDTKQQPNEFKHRNQESVLNHKASKQREGQVSTTRDQRQKSGFRIQTEANQYLEGQKQASYQQQIVEPVTILENLTEDQARQADIVIKRKNGNGKVKLQQLPIAVRKFKGFKTNKQDR